MNDERTEELRGLLTRFSEAHGVSGYEEHVGRMLLQELEGLADEVSVDRMGNVVGTRRGTGPTVMLAAHMDEIGLMVKHIDDEGFLRIVPLGGWFDQTLLGQRVVVHAPSGGIPGVVGCKPPHLMEQEERKKIVKLKDMFVDIGAADADAARQMGVEIGTPLTLDRRVEPLGNGYMTGKSFDDRAGVAMMVSALSRLRDIDIDATVHAVGTVQEEVGLKGARTSAFGLEPDVALVAEVTVAADHPGISAHERDIKTGKGPSLTVVDSDGRGIIVPGRVLEWLKAAADEGSIPYQLDVASGGTTDATAIHLTRTGVPTGVVAVPTRYIHSAIEVLSLEDLDRCADLLAQAIVSAPQHFVDL